MICTVCSVNLVYNLSTHELFCPKCGLVYGTIYYTFRRNLLEDHSFFVSYTEIDTKNLDPEELKHIMKLKKINRIAYKSKSKTQMINFKNYSLELGIQIDHKILDYYNLIKKSKLKTRYIYLFALILYAYQKGIKIDEKKLLETLKRHRLSKRKFNKLLRELIKEFNLKLNTDYTPILQEYLKEFTILNNYLNEIIETIEKIRDIYDKMGKLTLSKTLVSLAIYHIAKKYNIEGIKFKVSKTTLKKNYKLIEKYLNEEKK